ncbi:MAG: ribosome biogenesis GTPase Der [Patescibacteria group bacterium]|nr:ribosome biogenesis GTPase Der [Patescibacteria group bacterium]
MKKNTKKPLIAIVGRTNVGKSMLFNKLSESNKALVSAIPGTTRDRNFADCLWRGLLIQIIDTGGYEHGGTGSITAGIKKQIESALRDADLIFFVASIQDGVLPEDIEFAKLVKKFNKKVIFLANKSDNQMLSVRVHDPEWRRLNLGVPRPISAASGVGLGDALDEAYAVLKKIKHPPQPIDKIQALKIAVIGKPNVGKSSLTNSLLGEERMIVSDIAFTTREPQDTFLSLEGKNYLIVDTAGIRKHAKIQKGLETKGVEKTKTVADIVDIILFVLNISEPIGVQDKMLAKLVAESGKGVIVIANKWDLLERHEEIGARMNEYIHAHLPHLAWAPISFISAKSGRNVQKILSIAETIQKERERTIPAEELESFLRSALKHSRPIGGEGMTVPPKIYGMAQIGIAPPEFEIVVKTKHVIHPNYLKYIEKRMREKFGFQGTPIIVKSRSR